MHLDDHVEDYAKEMVGNWKEFDSFGWSNDYIDDPDNWAIMYTSNRDSGLLSKSNEEVIDKEMEPFVEDGSAFSESHGHWACGHIDGYSFRVYDSEGKPTAVCKALCEITMSLEQYPVLDESDYSQKEWDAAIENISYIAHNFVKDVDSDGWCEKVFSWLWDNEQTELENSDGQGAYPSEDSCKRALWSIGLLDGDYDAEWPEPTRHILLDLSDGKYELKTWDTGNRYDTGQWKIRYEFKKEDGDIIFHGSDCGCSPMHATDSDDCLRGLLGFLSLKPGDTDDEYFEDYTKEQMEFAENNGEELNLWSLEPEEGEQEMPFENLDDWEE